MRARRPRIAARSYVPPEIHRDHCLRSGRCGIDSLSLRDLLDEIERVPVPRTDKDASECLVFFVTEFVHSDLTNVAWHRLGCAQLRLAKLRLELSELRIGHLCGIRHTEKVRLFLADFGDAVPDVGSNSLALYDPDLRAV